MKKSLIALAVLSTVAGTAAAQSSAQFYGRIDNGYNITDATYANGNVKNTKTIANGALSTSRLGFNLNEDLGGGQRAIATVEWGLNTINAGGNTVDSAQTPTTTLRQSFVGISDAKLGQLTVGYQYTPEYNLAGRQAGGVLATGTTISGDSAVAVAWANLVSRVNSVRYSNRVGGVEVIVLAGSGSDYDTNTANSFSMKASDGTTSTTRSQRDFNQKIMSVGLNYAKGPLNVGASYLKNDATSVAPAGQTQNAGNAAAASDIVHTSTTLAADYDFKVVKAFAQYADRKIENKLTQTDTRNHKAYQVGLRAPVGKASFHASYAENEIKSPSAVTSDRKGTLIGVDYAFSKRTTAYLFSGTFEDKVATSTALKKQDQVAFGILHQF